MFMAFFMLTIEQIKQDAEILRLNELMRTTAIAINQRLELLWKQNNISVPPPLFEALIYGNVESDHLAQPNT